MYAILNYFDDPKLSERVMVEKGDIVTARESDFDLTEDKEYIVVYINGISMISIMNNKGIVDIYTVECFK